MNPALYVALQVGQLAVAYLALVGVVYLARRFFAKPACPRGWSSV